MGNDTNRSIGIVDDIKDSGGLSYSQAPISPPPETVDVMRTYYFTPTSSPVPSSSGVTAVNTALTRSPFVPPRHFLAPPPLLSAATAASISTTANDEQFSALQLQLKASQSMIAQLQAESRKLRDSMEEDVEEKRKVWEDLAASQREARVLEQRVLDQQASE